MIVYILTYNTEFEGGVVEGVFTSSDIAKAVAQKNVGSGVLQWDDEKMEARESGYTYWKIEQFTVNGAWAELNKAR